MASRGKAFIFTAACLAAAIGCGARTDTLFDEGVGGDGFGAFNAGGQAHGGSVDTAGSRGLGGSSSIGGFGTAGSFGFGGSNVGGLGTAGSFGTGGGFPRGGSGNVAGTGQTAGSSNAFGGSFSSGGFGAVGGFGEAGAAGTGGIVDLCVGTAQTACDKCLCQSCSSQINACFSNIGCALILACAQQKQCQGFNCYRNSTCRGVIDQFGGLTGAPFSEVFSLATCSVTSRTSCACN
jgi:hypothetical protein